ncbi:hypothetical protein, partial [Salmonella sp. SAL4435]|uniref:hypothetical protein n=1 Tax=Salmonella sp. SAL4435 TaxID=3159890 RepID=UPI00397B46E2
GCCRPHPSGCDDSGAGNPREPAASGMTRWTQTPAWLLVDARDHGVQGARYSLLTHRTAIDLIERFPSGANAAHILW